MNFIFSDQKYFYHLVNKGLILLSKIFLVLIIKKFYVFPKKIKIIKYFTFEGNFLILPHWKFFMKINAVYLEKFHKKIFQIIKSILIIFILKNGSFDENIYGYTSSRTSFLLLIIKYWNFVKFNDFLFN